MQNNRAQHAGFLRSAITNSSDGNFCYALRPDGSSEFDAQQKPKNNREERQFTFVNPNDCRGIVKLNEIESAIERCRIQYSNKLPAEPPVSPPRPKSNQIGNTDCNGKPIIRAASIYDPEDAPNFDYDEVHPSRTSSAPTASSSTGAWNDNSYINSINTASGGCNSAGHISVGGFNQKSNSSSYTNDSRFNSGGTSYTNSHGGFNNDEYNNHQSGFNKSNNNFDNIPDEFDEADDELLALDVDNIIKNKTNQSQPQQPSFNQGENNNRMRLRPIQSDNTFRDYNGGDDGNKYRNSYSDNYNGNSSTFGECYDNFNSNNNNYGNNDPDAPMCPGHNVPCRLLTAQTASNSGRQFYKCSLPGK